MLSPDGRNNVAKPHHIQFWIFDSRTRRRPTIDDNAKIITVTRCMEVERGRNRNQCQITVPQQRRACMNAFGFSFSGAGNDKIPVINCAWMCSRITMVADSISFRWWIVTLWDFGRMTNDVPHIRLGSGGHSDDSSDRVCRLFISIATSNSTSSQIYKCNGCNFFYVIIWLRSAQCLASAKTSTFDCLSNAAHSYCY